MSCIFCRVKLKALRNDHPHPHTHIPYLKIGDVGDQIIFMLLFHVLLALRRTKSERRYFYILIVHGLNGSSCESEQA